MRLPLRLLVAVLSAWLAGPASARDIHVNNQSGNDRFTGHYFQNMPDETGPVRTIAKALRLAGAGDRIILANTGQPYRESVSLVGSRHSGTSFQPFVIEGNGAILDGSSPVPAHAWEHYRGPVFRFRPPRIEPQQLFLNDRPLARVIGSRPSGAPSRLEPLQWCLQGGHIYFCVEPLKLPEDYRLSIAHQPVGITLFHVERVAIQNLTIQGFQIDGINAFNSARRVSLSGVTCRGNGRAGVAVGGASLVHVEDSLIGDNGEAQLLTQPYSATHVQQSRLLSNTAPAWVDRGGAVFLDGQPVRGGLNERANH
jgi:hypothetical protein